MRDSPHKATSGTRIVKDGLVHAVSKAETMSEENNGPVESNRAVRRSVLADLIQKHIVPVLAIMLLVGIGIVIRHLNVLSGKLNRTPVADRRCLFVGCESIRQRVTL